MSAKVKKLEDQFRSDSAIQQQRDGNSSSIFSGVAIYVNGLTGEPLIFLRNCIVLVSCLSSWVEVTVKHMNLQLSKYMTITVYVLYILLFLMIKFFNKKTDLHSKYKYWFTISFT